ncbi:hypothetical protein DPMN_017467 [Dreissena polymorpha]|uniref:Uncharacterized protein n=1 Tax=Dreissena polymorpha TaxID=45954 RepID=A0A9D4NF96_DREPO|nr:hypothetical protein DPMN_017467 [Dreissena polymorpha]
MFQPMHEIFSLRVQTFRLSVGIVLKIALCIAARTEMPQGKGQTERVSMFETIGENIINSPVSKFAIANMGELYDTEIKLTDGNIYSGWTELSNKALLGWNEQQ